MYKVDGQRRVKPGFHIVVPVARIVSVASNFWKRQGRSYGNALAITQDDPCDRNDQSSEIDSSSILATETTGKDSQAIAYSVGCLWHATVKNG